MKTIKFPKRLKWSTEETLEHFYKKCLATLKIKQGNKLINVTAFTINEKDLPILTKLLTKRVKKMYPRIGKKDMEFTIGWHMLDKGPSCSDEVEQGTVQVDIKKVLSERTKN